MTEGISRRDMVALAGAGLALSACKHDEARPATPTPCPRVWRGGYAGTKGLGDPWGLSAILDPDDPKDIKDHPVLGALAGKFKPGYVTILFIDFPTGWSMEINHASWGIDESIDEKARLDRVLSLLKAREKYKRFRFLPDDVRPTERISDQQRDFDSFEKFGFAHQSEIFIYLNNKDIILKPDWPIVFTPFSDDYVDVAPNFSFFKARIVASDSLSGAGLSGRMVRVRNYITDEDFNTIDAENKKHRNLTYSMNIHYALKCNGKEVSMIIDPDTGNGTGNEP